jgi:hypothetical protein
LTIKNLFETTIDMTFFDVRAKIIARWWLILAFIIGFSLAFFPWSTQRSFMGSIGLGISLNSPEYAQSATNNSSSYAEALTEFSLYMTNRFTSVEVQSKIAQEANLPITDYSPTSSFYEVTNQSGGYVSITHTFGTREEAERFIRATKEIYREVVQIERNSRELAIFKIDPKTDFVESVVEIRRSPQYQALPSLAGLLLGLTVAIIIPYKTETK